MKIINGSFSIGFALIITALVRVIIHAQTATSNFLILHFDSYRNIDFSGTREDLYMLIASALGMLLINFLLARFLSKREHFLSVVVSITSILLAGLLFLAVSVILANN